MTQMVKNLPTIQETQIQSLGQEDPLEKGMATHSSISAWKISWTEKPNGLQSMRVQRVTHDWTSNTSLRKRDYYSLNNADYYSLKFISSREPVTSFKEQSNFWGWFTIHRAPCDYLSNCVPWNSSRTYFFWSEHLKVWCLLVSRD